MARKGKQPAPRDTAASSATETPVITATYSSALSDDYIATAGVLVDASSPAPLGVFTMNGETQALFIRSDGVLCQISPASGQSAGGYSVTTVGTTQNVTSVAVGLQNNDVIYGFYTDPNNLYVMSLGSAGWSTPATLPLVSALNVTNNAVTGELVACGVSGGGNLALSFMSNGGTWTTNSISLNTSIGGTTPIVMFTDAQNDWIAALQNTTNGQLAVYQGSAKAMTSGPASVTTSNAVSQVVLGYSNDNDVMFLFTDTQNNFYSVVAGSQTPAVIPNVSVAQAAAILDGDNRLHCYLVDPDGNLSVLHQTGWESTTGPAWAPNIPLDSGFALPAADLTNSVNPASFFATDLEGTIHFQCQDQTTKLWWSGQAQTSGGTTPSAYNVPQYRNVAVFTDQNGNPQPGLEVTLTPSTTTAISSGGVLYNVTPSQPVTLTTNGAGQLTFSMIATEVSAPTIALSATNLTPVTIDPSAPVRTYLGGTGTLNAGGSNALAQFSTSTLQGATVNGQPLAPPVVSNSTLAQQSVQAIQNTIAATPGAGSTSAPAIVGWIFDLSDKSKPKFRSFTDYGEFQAERARALGGTADVSFWDEIAEFATDFWEGVKNAAIAVSKWIVDALKNTIDLVASIGGELQQLANLVISGIETVASIVHSIFDAIEAAVSDVIDWLKMIFGWQQIWDTATALSSGITQAFPNLQTIINTNQASITVNNFFANLKDQINSAFSAAQLQLTGTVGSLNTSSSGTGPLATIAEDLGDFVSSVHNNWFFDKLNAAFALDSGAMTIPTSTSVSTAVTNLSSSAATAWTTIVSGALSDFSTFVSNSLSDPSQLGTLTVSAVLTAVQDFVIAVLDYIDSVIQDLLALASAVISDISQFLTAPIPYPFILGVVQDILSDIGITLPAPSLLDVFCLAMAIPITLIYEIAYNEEPFPGGTLVAAQNPRRLQPAASSSPSPLLIAGGVTAILWTVGDMLLDALPPSSANSVSAWRAAVGILVPTALQVLIWPGGPGTLTPASGAAANWNWAAWASGWAPILFDGGLTLTGDGLSRYLNPLGMQFMTVSGAFTMALGLGAWFAGNTGSGQVLGYIAGPLPAATQFVRIADTPPSTVAKVLIDFFAGMFYGLSIIFPGTPS